MLHVLCTHDTSSGSGSTVNNIFNDVEYRVACPLDSAALCTLLDELFNLLNNE